MFKSLHTADQTIAPSGGADIGEGRQRQDSTRESQNPSTTLIHWSIGRGLCAAQHPHAPEHDVVEMYAAL
jgi:hypothetical protein